VRRIVLTFSLTYSKSVSICASFVFIFSILEL